METAKQKAIREAYGEHWETVKEYVDENGWVKDDKKGIRYNLVYESRELGEFEHDNNLFNTKIRLKSLKGIEDNRGWTRIESEDDLPKEKLDNEYYVIDELGTCIASFNFTRRKFQTESETIKAPTHYKPIIKPEPPIY